MQTMRYYETNHIWGVKLASFLRTSPLQRLFGGAETTQVRHDTRVRFQSKYPGMRMSHRCTKQSSVSQMRPHALGEHKVLHCLVRKSAKRADKACSQRLSNLIDIGSAFSTYPCLLPVFYMIQKTYRSFHCAHAAKR